MRQHPFTEAPYSLSQEEIGEWWLRTFGIVSKARCPKMLLCYRVRSHSLSAEIPFKQRKTKVVNLANTPGIGSIILSLTWFFWLFTRQNKYIWNMDWGQQPYDNNESGKDK